jgi:lauroyl/myristoyl acyltransferase
MIRNRLENRLKLICLDMVRPVLPYFPDSLIDRLARLSALFTYTIDVQKVRIMRQELRKHMMARGVSEEAINRIILRGIVNLRKDLFETWKLSSLTGEKIKKWAYFVGRENLDAALSQGRGAIILQTHFGLRKLILPALGHEGYKVNQLAERPTSWRSTAEDPAAHDKLMIVELGWEKSLPVKFIYIEESLRSVSRVLKENELLVMAIDGPIGLKRVGIKFLNGTAHFPPTPISLSLKTGAPVLPTFIVRERNDRHKIVFEKPLSFPVHSGKEKAIAEGLNNFRDLLESYVLHYPCHYVDWLYRAQIRPIEENLFVFQ